MPDQEYWNRINEMATKYLPEYGGGGGGTAVAEQPQQVAAAPASPQEDEFRTRITAMAEKYLPEYNGGAVGGEQPQPEPQTLPPEQATNADAFAVQRSAEIYGGAQPKDENQGIPDTPQGRRRAADFEFMRDEASLKNKVPFKPLDTQILSDITKQAAIDPVNGVDIAEVYGVRYHPQVRQILATANKQIKRDFNSAIADEFKVLGEKHGKGKIGFVERLSNKDWVKTIHVFGGAKSAYDTAEVYAAAKNIEKMQNGEIRRIPSQAADSARIIANFLKPMIEAQRRGVSWQAQVSEGVIDMVPYMVEIAVSGGVSKLLGDGAKKAVRGLVGKFAGKTARKFAGKTAGWVAKGAATSVTSMGGRTIEQGIRNMIGDISVDNNGKLVLSDTDSPGVAFIRALGSQTIQNMGEMAGETITKIGGKIVTAAFPKAGKFISKMLKYVKANPPEGKTGAWAVKTISNALKSGKYSGLAGEMGEEYLTNIMEAVAGTNKFGQKGDKNTVFNRLVASIPDVEQNLIMAATLSVPGATRFGVKHSANAFAWVLNHKRKKSIANFTDNPSRKSEKSLPQDVQEVAKDVGIDINSGSGRTELANLISEAMTGPENAVPEATAEPPAHATPEQTPMAPEQQHAPTEAISEPVTPTPQAAPHIVPQSEEAKQGQESISPVAES